MTPRRTHQHQPRPNRRFRRLVPAAVLTATLAAASAGPAAARADAQRAAHSGPAAVYVLPAGTKAATGPQQRGSR
jgi:peptidoglycan/LPS O-acetylase OafA/YrhL